MSRPRRYRPVETDEGWGLAGECVRTDCNVSGHWGDPDCGHWELLPGRWPTKTAAGAQAELWRLRQRTLLENGFDLRPAVAVA